MKKKIKRLLKPLYLLAEKRIKNAMGMPDSMALNYNSAHKYLANKWQRFFYKKKYSTEELILKLKDLGMHEGSCVFIQSSWDSFLLSDKAESVTAQSILVDNGTI